MNQPVEVSLGVRLSQPNVERALDLLDNLEKRSGHEMKQLFELLA